MIYNLGIPKKVMIVISINWDDFCSKFIFYTTPDLNLYIDFKELPGCRIGIGHSSKHDLDCLFRRFHFSSKNASLAMNSETDLYKKNNETLNPFFKC